MAPKTTGTLVIEKLTDRPELVKVLVYGDSGVGKTVFASSAPRPILWLEAEGGTHSIGDKEGIDIARVSGLESFREALVYLQANPGKYRTVVIDSLSETQAAVLKEIMGAVVAADETHTRDEFSPQFGEWGRLTGVMREIVRAFRDLPMNVVITALAREDKDEMTAKTRVKPRLSPTLADEVPSFMDAVVYMYAAIPTPPKKTAEEKDKEAAKPTAAVATSDEEVEVVRRGLIRPTGKYAAKIRAPKGSNPPAFISDPTFPKVAALIFPKPAKAPAAAK